MSSLAVLACVSPAMRMLGHLYHQTIEFAAGYGLHAGSPGLIGSPQVTEERNRSMQKARRPANERDPRSRGKERRCRAAWEIMGRMAPGGRRQLPCTTSMTPESSL